MGMIYMPSREKRRYVALTTQGSGWWVVCVGEPGESREEIERRAIDQLQKDANGENGTYYDTWRKNLAVMTLSAVRRAFPQAWRHYEFAQQTGSPY